MVRGGRAASESGVALVVTLILLSIITFMAIAFLVLSHREQSSVVTTTDETLARLAADAGLERAQAELLVSILASGNPYNIGLHVSTNYINPLGFTPAGPLLNSPINVNYDYLADGQFRTRLTLQQQQQNIANLQYSPRAPVYIVTNRTLGSNEFRYYLDLNRNGRFEPTGPITVTNALGQPTTVSNKVFLTANVVGDPQWDGELEFPDKPHSVDNRFIYRYAYAVVPTSDTLDINYIHNQAANPSKQTINLATGADYRRNQGVGTWEINLASFLYDLNTNLYGWGGVYIYNPLIPNVSGNSFFDACGILANRYGNVNVANALGSVSALFPVGGGPHPFASDEIDCYTAAPIMTTAGGYRGIDPDTTILNRPWPGADNTNHFFTPQDFYNPTKTSADFVNRLTAVSTNVGTYDRYTYYRLLSQLGTGSSSESGSKLNLNYDNLVRTNANGVATETNLYTWDAAAFFTNAASKMLLDAGYNFSVTNIQIWPTNFYTPSVHRFLQLAANIYDSTFSRTNPGVHCPTVFRPIFRRIPPSPQARIGEVVIAGYREVDQSQQAQWINAATAPRYLDLDLNTNDVTKLLDYLAPAGRLERDEYMLAGVPLVIGAKKGFPNFNEFAMQTYVYVSRLLEFRRDPAQPAATSPIVETNQMFVVTITNAFGIEAWNSYFTNYPNPLRVVATVETFGNMTNLDTGLMIHTNYSAAATPPPPSPLSTVGAGKWLGWTNFGLAQSSFVLPFGNTNHFTMLSNATYLPNPPRFVPQTHVFQRGLGFYIPRWNFALTTRVRFILFDTMANRIVDYVNLKNTEANIDLMAKLSEGADCSTAGPATYANPASHWCMNRQGGNPNNLFAPTYGVLNQIGVGLTGTENWNSFTVDPYAGNNAHKAVDGFRYNLLGWSPVYPEDQGLRFYRSNVFYAPFAPYHPIFIHTKWQSNDPLVHYTIGDLLDPRFQSTNINFTAETPTPMPNLGQINDRYQPWGGNQAAQSTPDILPFDMAAKDPLITRPDFWDFPTNKYPNVGWLGRVHRGTPWQTIFLKSTNVLASAGLTNWQRWTGDFIVQRNIGQISTNFLAMTNLINDAAFSFPTNDWRLMDLFTTAFNDNSTRGQLSVNQTNLAAWSAVLAGVNVLKNATNSVFIEPAGVYDPLNPTPLDRIVNGINFTRSKFPHGSFQRKGDILATPELTMASPYISSAGGGVINDAVVERIPQQIMGLLRGGEEPRFTIYSWGQTLKPAPRSVLPNGPFAGLCTNYTITAEVATRAIVRVVGAPNNPRTVVESFNVLPPD